MANIYLALIHYPVVNKNGDVIASAVTNLDLHDIARAAKTYGVKQFFVVTPLVDQQELIRQIVGHWEKGHGASYNPYRGDALQLITVKESFDDVVEHLREKDVSIKTIATSAREKERRISCKEIRNQIYGGQTVLLVFGTAWGLSDDMLNKMDEILEPVKGCTEYNHLSVRSAVSIILDRLVNSR